MKGQEGRKGKAQKEGKHTREPCIFYIVGDSELQVADARSRRMAFERRGGVRGGGWGGGGES
jgi:hypothetical protein